jgi:hypothetical protein
MKTILKISTALVLSFWIQGCGGGGGGSDNSSNTTQNSQNEGESTSHQEEFDTNQENTAEEYNGEPILPSFN